MVCGAAEAKAVLSAVLMLVRAASKGGGRVPSGSVISLVAGVCGGLAASVLDDACGGELGGAFSLLLLL